MHAKKTLNIAAVLPAGAVTLTGCGNDSSTNSGKNGGASTGASVSTGHNKADTTFAQEMIPHHGQAIDMAKAQASSAE